MTKWELKDNVNALIDFAFDEKQKAAKWLYDNDETVVSFDTIEEYDHWKAETYDQTDKYELYGNLIRTLKEVYDFYEYEHLFDR